MPKDNPNKGNKMQEALLQRMMQSDSVDSYESAIRIAKSKGWLEQKNGHLVLTQEGRNNARNAQRHMEKDNQE